MVKSQFRFFSIDEHVFLAFFECLGYFPYMFLHVFFEFLTVIFHFCVMAFFFPPFYDFWEFPLRFELRHGERLIFYGRIGPAYVGENHGVACAFF